DLWQSVVAPERGAVDATLLQRMTEAAAAAGDAALAVDMLAFAYGLVASLPQSRACHAPPDTWTSMQMRSCRPPAQVGAALGGHGLARPGARGAELRRAAGHAGCLQAVAA